MTQNAPTTDEGQSWKPKVLIIGALLGAVVGVAGAYLLVQNAERKGEMPQMSTTDGMRLAVLIFGLLRSVAALHE